MPEKKQEATKPVRNETPAKKAADEVNVDPADQVQKAKPSAKKVLPKDELNDAAYVAPGSEESDKASKPSPAKKSGPGEKKLPPLKEVKVPKTSVKTSIPYQPEYKSMEQRQETSKGAEMLVRYSDTELNEFREIIMKKLEASKKELAYLQGLITRKDDMGGDESENRYMTMEDGSISMEREQLSQMASRQISYIDHLEKALIRIENKTYGICRVTGKLIDKARLRAVPHATLSLEAKLGLVKKGD